MERGGAEEVEEGGEEEAREKRSQKRPAKRARVRGVRGEACVEDKGGGRRGGRESEGEARGRVERENAS